MREYHGSVKISCYPGPGVTGCLTSELQTAECVRVRITLVIVIVVALVVVLGLLGLIGRRRTRPLARHLRSTTFSQRRSDRIKRAAAADVAAVEQDDEYYRRARHGDPDDEI
jgi:hypothetical protein